MYDCAAAPFLHSSAAIAGRAELKCARKNVIKTVLKGDEKKTCLVAFSFLFKGKKQPPGCAVSTLIVGDVRLDGTPDIGDYRDGKISPRALDPNRRHRPMTTADPFPERKACNEKAPAEPGLLTHPVSDALFVGSQVLLRLTSVSPADASAWTYKACRLFSMAAWGRAIRHLRLIV
jgi:hypothetical protein